MDRSHELVVEGPVPAWERRNLARFLAALGNQTRIPADPRGARFRLPSVPASGSIPLPHEEGNLECVLPSWLTGASLWTLRVEDAHWGCHWHINGRPFLTRLNNGPFPTSRVPEEVVNLSLAGFFSFPDARQLPGFLAGLPRLESLEIYRFAFVVDLRVLRHCRSLRHLTLSAERLPSLVDLGGQENLRTLRLLRCHNLTGLRGVETLGELTRLEIHHCQSVRDLGPLASHGRLRDLVLLDTGTANLSPLAGMYRLETLVLADLCRLAQVAPMGPKPQLRELSIHHCPRVANLRCLRDLAGLRYCSLHGFTGKRVQSVFSLENLRSLDLSGCSLEDRDLLPLLRLQRLEALALTGAINLQHLYNVAGLAKLRRLELQGCYNLTTLGFLRPLRHLAELDLTLCTQSGPLDVLARLGGLERLAVSAVAPEAMDPGFLAKLPALRDLRLGGWFGLRDLSCLQALQHLDLLDIRGCHGLANFSHLAEVPNLSTLVCDQHQVGPIRDALVGQDTVCLTNPNILFPMVHLRSDTRKAQSDPLIPDPRVNPGQFEHVQEGVEAFMDLARRACTVNQQGPN